VFALVGVDYLSFVSPFKANNYLAKKFNCTLMASCTLVDQKGTANDDFVIKGFKTFNELSK
jgi:hypothetical protein